jgi:hypothetical protein
MKTCLKIFALGAAFLFASAAMVSAAPVKFQVNMEYQTTNIPPAFVPGADTVEVRGSFNGWSDGVALVNVPGTTLYTNTFDATGFNPGDIIEYKYHTYGISGDNWDAYQSYIYTNDGNRAFVFTGLAQTLAPVYFSDQWGGQVPLTFQVDMGPQVFAGNFVPGVDTVEVRGSWDGFSNGIALTNNPAGASINIYSMTIAEGNPAPGGLAAYKYHIYGSHDYNEPDANRIMLVTNPATTAPLVYFSNLKTNDLLPQDTLVTFSVNMSNVVSVMDSHTFDPGSDSVYINGPFANWYAYEGSYNGIGNWYSWPNFPAYYYYPGYQMFPQGSSLIYTNTILMLKGTPVGLSYKYGMDIGSYGYPSDDEAGFEVNHVRYVRTVGNYVLPADTFGDMASEISFGNLQIGHVSAGKIPVSWLGRPGVHLQTATSLTGGSWLDHLETDGFNSTNYPISTQNGFFRLIKP